MFPRIFNRKSGSVDENETPPESSNTLDDSVIGPSILTNTGNSSSPSTKKRKNLSSTNSETEDSKRQNLNDSFLQELDNMPSDHETSVLVPSVTQNSARGSDSSLIDQLNVPFDENTPYWVPILLRSFDSLKKDIQSNVTALSEEVKSFNLKFDTFCNDTSNRLTILENKSASCDAKAYEIQEKVNSAEENINSIKGKIDSLSAKTETDTSLLKTEFELIKGTNIELEKSAQFASDVIDEMKTKVDLLTSSNSNLLKSVDLLSAQLDSNEQHNRNECLLLHGVPESDKETPIQSSTLFVEKINHHLKADMAVGHIRRAHRLGKKRANGKPRPIIARFWDSGLRNHLFFNKKEFKNTSFSITENLTRRRMLIKNEAEGKYGSSNVWTKEGRIYAKGENNSIIPILL